MNTDDRFGNGILRMLPIEEAARLRPHLVSVPLAAGEFLEDAGEPASHLYFVTEGAISTVGPTLDGATVEVALTGREGVAGAFAALGPLTLPLRLQAQVPGQALRVDTAVVREELKDCGVLHDVLHAHLQRLFVQVSQSAICNRFHTSEQRLARWLLTLANVTGQRSFPLTHEDVAEMVGGPRSGITRAASRLRRAGTIDYSRSLFTIRRWRDLERSACECYGVMSRALAA